MSSKLLSLVGSAILFGCVAGSAYAQNPNITDQASASASAKILEPISITNQKVLNFGAVIPDQFVDGFVTVTPTTDFSMSATGLIVEANVVLLPQHSDLSEEGIGGYGQARFRIDGEPGFYYTIQLPVDPPSPMPLFNIKTASPVYTLDVSDFVALPQSTGAIGTEGVLNNIGVDRFNVGAKLHVKAGAQPGVYRREFNVTVTYQ